jgi:phosphoribosylaminoimidazole-succinocarboxamide synthase
MADSALSQSRPDAAMIRREVIHAALWTTLSRTSLGIGRKYTGKVRDVYVLDRHLVLVTTDRLSAFDRLLAAVPFKGAVLNLVSAWWFEQTRDIIPNHVIAVPHPNVTIARKLQPFKVEIIVRAYLTGTTSTSIWTHYSKGARQYCGHELPEGEHILPLQAPSELWYANDGEEQPTRNASVRKLAV